jgi:hypothetical protein
MSTQPALPLSTAVFSTAASGRSGERFSIAGLSLNGVLLFVISLLVVASGFTSLRPLVMGLMIHPCLGPIALAFPFVVMSRIHLFPIRVLAALLIFIGMYSFSGLNGGRNPVGEVFRISAAVVTIVTCALLVRRRGDFVAGALGLSIAVALLGFRGLQAEDVTHTKVMEAANKNAYSLFALPAILLAGYIVLRWKTVPTVVKAIFVGGTVPALVVIFMGGNRSGYLGAVLVALMLFWDRRGKGILLVGVIAAVVAYLILQFGSTVVLDERLRHTVEGNKSDVLRRDIVLACLQVGLENPVAGVGPQMLGFEIAHRVGYVASGSVEAHNVFAHIFAGSGLICFAALLAVGWTLWTWEPRGGGKVGGREDPFREGRRLMRMLVILWVVRGMFTAEILFNLSFNIALGLVIGLCMLAEVARQNDAMADPNPMQPAPRLPPGALPAAG